MSTPEEALARFDALFDEAWRQADTTQRRLEPGSLRGQQLRGLLRQLHRAREQVLHGDWAPGSPGGGLGLAGMVGRGFELDVDPDPGVRGAGDAARALESAFDSGLGLAWDGPDGRPAGWADVVRTRPPTPEPPDDEPPDEPAASGRRRWGWRGGR